MAHRPANPQPIRIQERDERLMETLYVFDSLMSRKQIAELFFDGKDDSTATKDRLKLLFDNGYLNQPQKSQRHNVPQGEWLYWLDKKGYRHVAGLRGETASPADLTRKHPPFAWQNIPHHLCVNDVRIAVMQAVAANPQLELQEWVSERQLHREGVGVHYTTATGKQRTRKVIPDGYFLVTGPHPTRPDKRKAYAYLLEVDRANETQVRVDEEKVRAGRAYLRSGDYRRLRGLNFGRWLVVTTGGKGRMNGWRQLTVRAEASDVFYFAMFDDLSSQTVFGRPIWYLADKDRPLSLPQV